MDTNMHAELSSYVGDNVRSSRTRRTRKAVELIPDTFSSVQLPRSSKLMTSVAFRRTEDVDTQVVGCRLVNFRKHAYVTPAGHRLPKTKRHQWSGPTSTPIIQNLCNVYRQHLVHLNATAELVQCDVCQRRIHLHCANYMDHARAKLHIEASYGFKQSEQGVSFAFTTFFPSTPKGPKTT